MLISIITPTYNRASKLSNAFNSLKNQTFKDFEWIIIDDGSTDNTNQVVSDFMENCSFEIKYIKIPHNGKHFATRRAYEAAKGAWAFELDSDDTLYNDTTLETIRDWILNANDSFCAIAGCFIDQHDNKFPPLNQKKFIDYDRTTYIDTFCNPNTWDLLNIPWVVKTDYARSVLPPQIKDNLSYFPEAVINLRRVLKNNNFHLRVYNIPIYRYNVFNQDSVSVNTNQTNAMWWYHKSMILDLNEWNIAKKYPVFYKLQVRGLLNFPSKNLIEKWRVFYASGDLRSFWYNLPRYCLKKIFSVQKVNNKHQITILGLKITL